MRWWYAMDPSYWQWLSEWQCEAFVAHIVCGGVENCQRVPGSRRGHPPERSRLQWACVSGAGLGGAHIGWWPTCHTFPAPDYVIPIGWINWRVRNPTEPPRQLNNCQTPAPLRHVFSYKPHVQCDCLVRLAAWQAWVVKTHSLIVKYHWFDKYGFFLAKRILW